ncbi:hypothetical protein M404DRAFT_169524, partial [Pisolithus tinctorius Marx 270]
QELAVPMVMSYLIGWSDTYCSHQYMVVYWMLFVTELFASFPELQGKDQVDSQQEWMIK